MFLIFLKVRNWVHKKKSVAINFVFNAVDKTLTDMEIDAMMKKLVKEFENNLQAEIRK